MRIAVVEDDADIRALVSLHMKRTGYATAEYADGGSFLDALRASPPDLVILDLMLPDMDGLDICRRLRADARFARIPIIMVTARAEEADRVVGLELGADDYLTKPFSPRELVARVKAVLRRRGGTPAHGERITIGGLFIDPGKHEVTVDGRPVELTATEFRLLHILAAKAGWVLSRDRLLRELWGDEKVVIDRTIDVHVKNLRRKMGKAGALVRNIRGVGYKVEP